MHIDRFLWLLRSDQLEPLNRTGTIGSRHYALLRVVEPEPDRDDLSADVRWARTRFPQRHVGLLLPGDMSSTLQAILRDTTEFDFLVVKSNAVHVAAVEQELLAMENLARLASNWFRAHSLSATQHRAVCEAHRLRSAPLTVPELASTLAVSERSLRRIISSSILGNPHELIMVSRLVMAALDIVRESRLSIATHAAERGFPEYSSFRRSFHSRFGFRPAAAKEITGPAELWCAWLKNRVRRARPPE